MSALTCISTNSYGQQTTAQLEISNIGDCVVSVSMHSKNSQTTPLVNCVCENQSPQSNHERQAEKGSDQIRNPFRCIQKC